MKTDDNKWFTLADGSLRVRAIKIRTYEDCFLFLLILEPLTEEGSLYCNQYSSLYEKALVVNDRKEYERVFSGIKGAAAYYGEVVAEPLIYELEKFSKVYLYKEYVELSSIPLLVSSQILLNSSTMDISQFFRALKTLDLHWH